MLNYIMCDGMNIYYQKDDIVSFTLTNVYKYLLNINQYIQAT